QNFPVGRCILEFINTCCQIPNEFIVIALDHLAVEKVDPIDSEWDQETHRDGSSGNDLPPSNNNNRMESILSTITDVQQSQCPQSLERSNSPRNTPILIQRTSDIDPKGNQDNTINEAPRPTKVCIRC